MLNGIHVLPWISRFNYEWDIIDACNFYSVNPIAFNVFGLPREPFYPPNAAMGYVQQILSFTFAYHIGRWFVDIYIYISIYIYLYIYSLLIEGFVIVSTKCEKWKQAQVVRHISIDLRKALVAHHILTGFALDAV